ncbi:MAG: class I SAM-dependent methyltransferase [Ruminococcaceae bacterium]|nr:class I SAM-dependent methyltransferase [Oscillospiraceae bacterium]
MNNVKKTLYIPLYGKCYVSRRGLFLKDVLAETVWERAEFPLKRRSRSKWLAYYLGIRAAVFDDWLRERLREDTDTMVLHLGCGLDNRIGRVGFEGNLWYDVDLPDVIDERKKHYVESSDYRMLGADLREAGWLSELPRGKRVAVVMEGIGMYLSSDALKGLFAALEERFEQVFLLIDCYSPFAARMSKIKNPIKEVGVSRVYGVDDPRLLEAGGLIFSRSLDMSPSSYIDELEGMERRIFSALYAGKTSKRLYRLYEFKSTR